MDELGIKMNANLNVDEETKKSLKTFFAALKNLPKNLDIDISFDNNQTSNGNTVKFNVADLVINQVRNHFQSK